MLTEERKSEILNIVNDRRSITVQELKDMIDVSESTVRRDISALAKEGKLMKVFGGAVALDDPAAKTDVTVLMKESINRAEKLTIARYAAQLIVPGDCVYLDAGIYDRLYKREESNIYNKFHISCSESCK